MRDRSVTSAEDALRLQSHAFRASMDGMAILDADERYVFLNDAHARLYGYDSPEQLQGQSWRVLYSPQQLRRFDTEILPALWRDGSWRTAPSCRACPSRRNLSRSGALRTCRSGVRQAPSGDGGGALMAVVPARGAYRRCHGSLAIKLGDFH